MERKPKDTFKVQSVRSLSSSDIDVLLTLYQPLIGGDSVLVYLTLMTHRLDSRLYPHARLFSLMNNISSDTFERSCSKLEEYMLLRTYVKESDTKNNFLYQINTPLSAKDFLSNSIYASRFMRVAGKKSYEETMTKYGSELSEIVGYKEITTKVKNIQEDEYDNAIVYNTVKPRLAFSDDDTTINFDYDRFLTITSTTVFPASLRTQENMALIGKLATVYGISPERMKTFVCHCVSILNETFNENKLRFLCQTNQSDVKEQKDPYALSPISFLQAKQNGAEVTLNDKKLLEHLSVDMHFSNEVINVMIEYILKVSDNRLNHKFVDMVAGEWARDGVSTKQEAIEETKKKVTTSSRKTSVKIKTPDYMSETPIKQSNVSNQQLIDEIKQMQKKMGGKS